MINSLKSGWWLITSRVIQVLIQEPVLYISMSGWWDWVHPQQLCRQYWFRGVTGALTSRAVLQQHLERAALWANGDTWSSARSRKFCEGVIALLSLLGGDPPAIVDEGTTESGCCLIDSGWTGKVVQLSDRSPERRGDRPALEAFKSSKQICYCPSSVGSCPLWAGAWPRHLWQSLLTSSSVTCVIPVKIKSPERN